MTALARAAVGWYERHARELPWRAAGVGAWPILVSEVMLQQTPAARVVPVWQEWVARWPTPAALAADTPAAAIRVWGRLGYPRRALRLHECAGALVERHGGEVPRSVPELAALPGVGGYTARAVAVFAYRQRHPVVDTNVRRLVARLVAGNPDAGPSTTGADLAAVEALLPPADGGGAATDPPAKTGTGVVADPPAEASGGAVAEPPAEGGTGTAPAPAAEAGGGGAAAMPTAAMASIAFMELGAVVCTARDPRCGGCPLRDSCAWYASGRPLPPGPSRRPQRYAGTDRQVRGALLAVLRDATHPVAKARLDRVWDDTAQRERALASLLADGLVRQLTNDRYALPGAGHTGRPTASTLCSDLPGR